MHLISDADFHRLALNLGIGRTPEYPHSEHLKFLNDELDLSRFWSYPVAAAREKFAAALLEVASPTELFWFRPTNALWSHPNAPPQWALDWDRKVAALGVPAHHKGAVGLEGVDPRVRGLLLAQLDYDTGVLPETLVLPSHGGFFWFFEHRDVVWGEFRELTTLKNHVASLTVRGFALPTEPPDWTFKPLPWLL